MLGEKDTHPWSAMKVEKPHTSHCTSNKKTNKLLKPASMQSTGRSFLKLLWYKGKKIRLYVIIFFKGISVAHGS